MKRKVLAVMLTICMAGLMSACAVSTDTGETPQKKTQEGDAPAADGKFAGTTIEIAERFTGATSEAFALMVKDFEAESGCRVLVTEYGDDYESTMKTRMASNTLPDIFETHGWSIMRYKEYLLDLQKEPWVSDYNESALGVIQDKGGEIYVLMLSQLVNGSLVNLEVCEKSGVDPYTIETYQDFTDACAKIKEAGYTPIGEAFGPGNLANIAGTWVSYEGSQAEDSEAMLNGTYNWESFKPFLDLFGHWLNNGYLFEDYATMKPDDASERFSQNKSAFWLGNDPKFLAGCLRLNPDGKYAFLPTFTSKEGGQMFVGVGEGETFGIWKDGENIEASKAFLEFMARPENAVRLTSVSGTIPCLNSAMEISDSYGLSLFKTMQDQYKDANIFYENLWDRKYMPTGMWPIFGNALQMFIADHSDDGTAEALDYLLTNYQDLYEAAKAE